jgi:RNA polymerase sigma-70 factor (ECF subfamily)
VYYRSGDQELATDIAQEVFMRLWEKQITVEKEKIAGLLYKMAGDLFISKYRRMRLEHAYGKRFSLRFDQAQSPEEQMQYKELKDRYELALASLPEKQRTVFLMSRMEDLKYYEIAERLHISVKAVEKRMKNALAFLRSVIGS